LKAYENKKRLSVGRLTPNKKIKFIILVKLMGQASRLFGEAEKLQVF
jgi:hypothetical protein